MLDRYIYLAHPDLPFWLSIYLDLKSFSYLRFSLSIHYPLIILLPFVPQHLFPVTMPNIAPGDIGTDVRTRLVNSASNPSNCFCGWYIYYSSVCTHVYQDVPVHCGARTTKSGKSGFCFSPAPRNNIGAVKINVKCRTCWYQLTSEWYSILLMLSILTCQP